MFRKIAEGDVFATTNECATSGPRTAVLADGTIVCSFMINTCGGANDFVPMIAYSKDGGLTWGEYVTAANNTDRTLAKAVAKMPDGTLVQLTGNANIGAFSRISKDGEKKVAR